MNWPIDLSSNIQNFAKFILFYNRKVVNQWTLQYFINHPWKYKYMEVVLVLNPYNAQQIHAIIFVPGPSYKYVIEPHLLIHWTNMTKSLLNKFCKQHSLEMEAQPPQMTFKKYFLLRHPVDFSWNSARRYCMD